MDLAQFLQAIIGGAFAAGGAWAGIHWRLKSLEKAQERIERALELHETADINNFNTLQDRIDGLFERARV